MFQIKPQQTYVILRLGHEIQNKFNFRLLGVEIDKLQEHSSVLLVEESDRVPRQFSLTRTSTNPSIQQKWGVCVDYNDQRTVERDTCGVLLRKLYCGVPEGTSENFQSRIDMTFFQE